MLFLFSDTASPRIRKQRDLIVESHSCREDLSTYAEAGTFLNSHTSGSSFIHYTFKKMANGHTHEWRTWNGKSDYIKPFLFCVTHESDSCREEPLVLVLDWFSVLSSGSSLEQTSFAAGWGGACSPNVWDTMQEDYKVRRAQAYSETLFQRN